MIGFRPQPRFCAPLLLLAALTATGSAALAQDNEQSKIPTCDKKIGTMSVAEPEQKRWLQYNLESPEALLKVYAAQSHPGGSRQGLGRRATGACTRFQR